MVTKMISQKKYFPVLVFQIVLIILFCVFVRTPKKDGYNPDATYRPRDGNGTSSIEDREITIYDVGNVHVMIFVGFGFLMTFLKKYSFSAVGFNLFLASIAVQWAIFCQQAFSMNEGTIMISSKALLEADIMAATVLISFGAVLGLTSPLQLTWMVLVEVAVGCANLYLVEHKLKATDAGGSITIHTFGAYFGLAASIGFNLNKLEHVTESRGKSENKAESSYISDVTAMIGTIFLWVYWPTFNSILAPTQYSQERAIINTYLSLAAATVTTFVFSSLFHKEGKLDMVHIQNSTLAGGVAIGAIANILNQPGVALVIGVFAGFLSVVGYRFLTPKLEAVGVLDTCGVNNLHGMPGVLSGIISILLCFVHNLGNEAKDLYPLIKDGNTASTQALFQLAALASTIVIASVSGFLTGRIGRTKYFEPLKDNETHEDELHWHVPGIEN